MRDGDLQRGQRPGRDSAAQRSSTSASVDTTRPPATASRASSARRRRPPRSAGAPATWARSGPSTSIRTATAGSTVVRQDDH
ncbi:hypothetical protein KDL28_39575 [Pseudonocardia sp. S2-4]|uniref:Uncharacterized protein n=1 Tax=Pseudonocardia humida TaxID=2800819 RepID=A0ABT1ADM2_9PSEU|nr:hypothetical protein [Pseudonocardia humida]